MGQVTPGKRFEHDFSQSLNRLDGFSLRLLDGGAVTKNQMPGDFLFWNRDGVCFLIECKATRQKAFPFASLKPHQLQSLLTFENLSPFTSSIVAVNYYGDDLTKKNRCVLIPAWKFAVFMSKADRKSLPIEDALKIGVEVPRITGGVWNLQQAFGRTKYVVKR